MAKISLCSRRPVSLRRVGSCLYLLLALPVLIPAVAAAQNHAPIFNQRAAAAISQRKDVVGGAADLRKLEAIRGLNIRNLGFEDGATCVAPVPISASDIDMHRTLFVHDDATLSVGNFTLRRTLQKLSSDVSTSVAVTPESIFRQFMDSQNDSANQVTAGNAHCSDNNGKINGYPFNKCPRPEGIEATGAAADVNNRIDNDYKPLAMVNRIDLADKGWKNCGEHRIVYGRQDGFAKNLIIFEAVLPNPKPGCRSGCRDVIEFWLDLSVDAAPASRAAKLENFFYNGLPGFRPVVHTSHYSSGVSTVYGGSGSGQVRTNQFLNRTGVGQGPWTLKEFKTFLSCAGGACDYDVLPISVKVNPFGALWNKDVATGAVTPPLPPSNTYATAIGGLAPLASNFQAEVLSQVTFDRLANPDLNSVTYEVKLDKNSAESQSQGPVIDHYPNQFNAAANATFRNNLNTLAAGFGLTGAQIVNRATANSCAGCHLPPAFGLTNANAIGPGVSWPNALSFVHVDTLPMVSLSGQPGFNAANFGGNAQGFNISPALLTSFLPARQNHLVNIANTDVCDCVPKSLRKIPDRFKEILTLSRQRLQTQLNSVRDNAIAKPVPDSARQLFVEQRSVIRRAEAARDAELERSGMSSPLPALRPEPTILANERLPGERLKALKRERLQQLVNSEPPRESITGSFRPH